MTPSNHIERWPDKASPALRWASARSDWLSNLLFVGILSVIKHPPFYVFRPVPDCAADLDVGWTHQAHAPISNR